MADAYWRYTSGVQQQQQQPPQQAAALPQGLVAKRPRTEFDAPSGPELAGYYGRDDERGMPRVVSDPIEASYERYLRSAQLSSHVTSEPARSMSSGFSAHPIEDPRVMGIVGSDPLAGKKRSVAMVGGRPEISLPPDASNTLFVEGLPGDCKRREVAHIFRPFVGYREVRLVPKGSRHPGGDPLILCFVDFASPLHAAAAMDALQAKLLNKGHLRPIRRFGHGDRNWKAALMTYPKKQWSAKNCDTTKPVLYCCSICLCD